MNGKLVLKTIPTEISRPVCSHWGCDKDKTIWSQLCRPAGQAGGGLRLLSQQPGSLSDRERQISSFDSKKKLWQVLYNQMQTKDIGRQRRKNPAGGHHHAGSWGFLAPLHDSSGRVSAYCSLNVRPARGPSDSGCARGQCGHCTPRTCEGSQGDIKMNICV